MFLEITFRTRQNIQWSVEPGMHFLIKTNKDCNKKNYKSPNLELFLNATPN